MRRLFPKKVYRQIKKSSQVKPGQDSTVNGFGYTIIPIDLARKDYVKLVYQTGYIMVVSSDNEIFRDVKVPNHLIDDLIFPQEVGEYGQLISWSIAKAHNQLFVTGIYTKPGEFHPYLENVSVHKFPSRSHEITVSADGNAPSYIITVYNGEESSGGMQFKAHSRGGSSSLSLNTDGTGELSIDDTFKAVVEKRLEVNLGQDIKLIIETDAGLTYTDGEQVELVIEKDIGLTYKDAFGNVLTMIDGEVSIVDDLNNSILMKQGEMAIGSDSVNLLDKQVVINDKTITIAQGTSPLVLGDKLVQLLGELITQVSLITVVAPSSGGPTTPPTNAQAIINLSSQLQDLISQTAFTK